MNEATDREVIVTLRLFFKPGTLDMVLEETIPIARLTREEPGNVEFNIYRPKGTIDQLIIFERWAGQLALEQHWEQDYTKRVLTLFDENLLHPLSQSDDVTYLSDVLGTPPSQQRTLSGSE